MRTLAMCALTSVLLVGGPWSAVCRASEPGLDDVGFLALGLGVGTTGPAGVVSLNFSRGDFFFGARLAAAEEFDIFGPQPALSDRDIALLAGVCNRTHAGFVSGAVGIGALESVRRGRLLEEPGWFSGGRYERIDRTSLAIPFDIKATAHGRAVGLGLNVFGAVGRRGGFFGVALVLQAGALGATP